MRAHRLLFRSIFLLVWGLSLCLLFVPPAAAQSTGGAKPSPGQGYIQGGAYHNVLFGFSYKIPEGWEGTTVEKHDQGALAQKSAKDEDSAKKMKQGLNATVSMLTVTRAGTHESILVSAFDVYFQPGTTPESYLNATEESIGKMTSLKVEKLGDQSKEVAGRTLMTRWFKTTINDKSIYQAMTVFIDQKYAVQFVGTFTTQESLSKYDVASALTFAAPVAAKVEPKIERKEAKPRNPQPEDAKVEGGKYTNTFFNLTVSVPEGWVIQEREAVERLRAAGERQLAKTETEVAAPEEAAAAQPHFLLTAMPKTSGAVLMSFCQDLLLAPEVESAEQYLKLMEAGMPGGEWISAPKPVTNNGRSYARGEYLQRVGDVQMVHLIYVTMERKFAIVFDVITASPELRAQGQKIVESMVFSAPVPPVKKP